MWIQKIDIIMSKLKIKNIPTSNEVCKNKIL
jgi:hypothetical protein